MSSSQVKQCPGRWSVKAGNRWKFIGVKSGLYGRCFISLSNLVLRLLCCVLCTVRHCHAEESHYQYEDWDIFSCLQKTYNSSDFQKKISFPSGSLRWIAAAVLLLHVCLESHDHEQKNSVIYMNSIWNFMKSSISNNRTCELSYNPLLYVFIWLVIPHFLV